MEKEEEQEKEEQEQKEREEEGEEEQQEQEEEEQEGQRSQLFVPSKPGQLTSQRCHGLIARSRLRMVPYPARRVVAFASRRSSPA